MQQAHMIECEGPVAGVDEAGRGPLAGPVVAAAVILHPQRGVSGLDDSKKLSAARRDQLAGEIKANALAWSVAWADPAEIDAINILAATMLAMRRAILGLAVTPNGVQVDGNRLPDLRINGRRIAGEAIIGGDALVPAISAASIIAKTTRDRIMIRLDNLYRARLQEFGPCEQHRRSFAPVRLAG